MRERSLLTGGTDSVNVNSVGYHSYRRPATISNYIVLYSPPLPLLSSPLLGVAALDYPDDMHENENENRILYRPLSYQEIVI